MPMIIGIGSDLVEINRIEQMLKRFPKRFLERVFSEHERHIAQMKLNPAAYLAKRFSAKEAFLKAIGLGLREGISWPDIGVVNDAMGRPHFQIQGRAHVVLQSLGATRIHLSLTDTQSLAMAYVVIEGHNKT